MSSSAFLLCVGKVFDSFCVTLRDGEEGGERNLLQEMTTTMSDVRRQTSDIRRQTSDVTRNSPVYVGAGQAEESKGSNVVAADLQGVTCDV